MSDNTLTGGRTESKPTAQTDERLPGQSKEQKNEFVDSFDCSKISFFNQSSKKSEINSQDQLKSILNRKRQTLQALKTLEDEESSVRNQLKQFYIRPPHKQRSEFTREDRNTIKHLQHRSEAFEESILRRDKAKEEDHRTRLLKQRQDEALHLQSIKQHHHLEAQHKLTLIKERQREREKLKQKSLEKEKQIKSRSYFFERIRTLPEESPSKDKKKGLNVSDIIAHEKHYRSMTQQDQQVRKAKQLEMKKQFKDRSQKKYPESPFAVILRNQKETEKKKAFQKVTFPERYSNRVSEYGKIIRQQYQPRHKDRTEPSLSKDSSMTRPTKQTKSSSELKQMGEDYLSFCKKKGSKKQRDPNNVIQLPNNTINPLPDRPVYKNYMKEAGFCSTGCTFEMRFGTVLKEGSSPQKIYKLRTMLEKEELLNPNPDEGKLQVLIDAKLSLINCIL